MHYRPHCLTVLALLAWSAAGLAAQDDTTLDMVLSQMEKRGSAITSMSASLEQKKWTAILEEFDEGETGRFLFLKARDAVLLRREITEPQPSSLVIADGQAVFYQPVLKQAHRHHLGKNRDRTEFLILGFGSDRAALEEAYQLRLLGEEELKGLKTYRIEMLPRSESAQAYFSRIVLWIDAQRWIPLQQKLIEPTDDYLLVGFDDIVLNPNLGPGDFKLKLPKDTQIVGMD